MEGQKAEALRYLVERLVESGRYPDAEQLAYEIQDADRQTEALRILTLSLAKIGEERAHELFARVTERTFSSQHELQGLYQANALRDFALLLTKGGDTRSTALFVRATEVANDIKKENYRAEALRNLANG